VAESAANRSFSATSGTNVPGEAYDAMLKEHGVQALHDHHQPNFRRDARMFRPGKIALPRAAQSRPNLPKFCPSEKAKVLSEPKISDFTGLLMEPVLPRTVQAMQSRPNSLPQAIAAYYEQQALAAKKNAALHRRVAETYRHVPWDSQDVVQNRG
jgi:hypothetical protein